MTEPLTLEKLVKAVEWAYSTNEPTKYYILLHPEDCKVYNDYLREKFPEIDVVETRKK